MKENKTDQPLPDFLTPKGRKKAARKRNFTRGFRAFFALVIAVFAGMYLVGCSIFKPASKNEAPTQKESKTKTDRKEHRKGMPVRDNIVE